MSSNCIYCGKDHDVVCPVHDADKPTLRDRFAMAALGQLYQVEMTIFGPERIREIMGGAPQGPRDDMTWWENVAEDAYKLADAMMKERAK